MKRSCDDYSSPSVPGWRPRATPIWAANLHGSRFPVVGILWTDLFSCIGFSDDAALIESIVSTGPQRAPGARATQFPRVDAHAGDVSTFDHHELTLQVAITLHNRVLGFSGDEVVDKRVRSRSSGPQRENQTAPTRSLPRRSQTDA